MRRVIFEEKGGPEVLKFETLDLPSPATGGVRIKIKAIGLNRYESMFRQGVYVVPPELPSAIGAEAVGIVEALARISHTGPDFRAAAARRATRRPE
jgi:NADPH:quinone reductase-like Zn-dependent oxidoreductase